MKDYQQYGITQRTMASMAKVVPSTINRYILSNHFQPLPVSGIRNLRYSVDDSRKIISDLYRKNYTVTHPTLSFYNFKGGVGKTSMCYQISTHLAMMGYNVLAVDTDPQGHLSTSFGFNNSDSYFTLYDAIEEQIAIKDVIKPVFPGLDCIPSNLSLTRIEMALNMMPRREERVKIVLESVRDKYDYIIFDTNPTISNLNRNVITCSDLINVVCETQPYSLNGLKLLLEDIHKFYHFMKIEASKILIIPNKYEDRMSSSAEAMTALREYYADLMKTDFAIRKSEEINTSAKMAIPLAFFSKVNSNALEDIIELLHHILKLTTHKNDVKI
jgi:chromosome partitioning protein